MYLWSYDISTNSGYGVNSMMEDLYSGKVVSHGPGDYSKTKTTFKNKFLETWQTSVKLQLESNSDFFLNKKNGSFLRIGLLLATTKGHLEDYIWLSKESLQFKEPHQIKEPGADLMDEFLNHSWPKELPNPLLSTAISQACSSTHIAFQVAKYWLDENCVDGVIILAGDIGGRFVTQGFASLKIMTNTIQKPFDKNRDGLFLGDAIGMALVSNNKPPRDRAVKIKAVSNFTEGAVTRPSLSGECLFKSLEALKVGTKQPVPDFIVAHGTGTRFNDIAEDRALAKYFQSNGGNLQTPITGAKWCLGHTLGASGLVDIIAAAEVIRQQKLFYLANSKESDPEFLMKNYLYKTYEGKQKLNQAIVTSLGFGGVHAAAWLEGVKL